MDVLADVEALREQLGVERWVVLGGSTGAMLAMLYAVEFPSAVLAIVLRGTWLLRRKDIDWCYGGGMAHFYPEEWRDFVEHVGHVEGCNSGARDPVSLYWERLQCSDQLAVDAAHAWLKWDNLCGCLVPATAHRMTEVERVLGTARIGVYWYAHFQQWYPDEYILHKAQSGVLQGIPVHLVNGRYDLLCPPLWSFETAQALKAGGASCTMHLVDATGHASSEPGIKHALEKALSQLKYLQI